MILGRYRATAFRHPCKHERIVWTWGTDGNTGSGSWEPGTQAFDHRGVCVCVSVIVCACAFSPYPLSRNRTRTKISDKGVRQET